MSLTSAQNRFSMMSMGVPWLIPPVLYVTSPVVLIVRLQLIGAYLLSGNANAFTLPPASSSVLLDATYVIVRRYVRGQFVYYTERLDDRLWQVAEDAWCVDCGEAYPLYAPSATLTAASASGNQSITSYIVIQGGSGYTAPQGTINDPTGSGATFSFSVVGGVITAVTAIATGNNYSNPQFVVTDSAGSGAIIQPVVTNWVNFTTDQPILSSSHIGNVLRMSGGIATIVAFNSSTSVTANVTTPINQAPNDPGDQPIPAPSGAWTMGVPTSVVTGLNHLEGLTVTGLADGYVISPRTVVSGSITLDTAATMITVGLPFTAQLQSLYLDIPGEATVQGKRKTIQAVTARVEASRGFKITTNQSDASIQPNDATVTWTNLVEWKQPLSSPNPTAPLPLFSGDARVNVRSSWRKQGQVAVQQDNPLPLNVLALIPEWTVGDENG